SNGIFSPVEIGSTSVQAILKENPSIQTRAEITVPDTEPPKAITATPGSGNQNIPVTSNIQIVFSEDIRFDTIPGGVRIKGANGRDITGKFDLKDKVLSFIPDKPFNDEETITVTATTAIKDMSGNSLASELRFSFSTGIGIWPGDSDNDGNVNILDILPIGQFWNSKGQKRDNPGSNWSIHPAISWQPNKKATYADTNGDGLVDERDIIPIALNWRLSHSLENVALSPANNNMAVYPDADYKAMYQVLESMPIETEGVLALKAILREFILEIENQNKPQKSLLMQNYPNPFNPETWIPYQLKEGSMVKISIFNSFGQLVRDLDLGFKQAGFYMDSDKAAYWDGKNEAGERVSSGCYFYTITTHKPFPIRKMVLKK
ncbi:hypothetical protein FJZ33_10195, partial [Candidatus Poribacteria bacterium]|nr:hypothetical protein [Candidatus Poribacteria bacterium]